MLINIKHQEVTKDLEKEIDKIQKEATNVLRMHQPKVRFQMNNRTTKNEAFLKSEEAWNTINNKLKTLKQIKNILESYKNKFGIITNIEDLDNEFLNYINIANEKKLYNIAKIFKYYRKQLRLEHSQTEELIKLKIKDNNNSQHIKETFLKACRNLDASIFEPLIDEDQYFEELDKYRFLQSMKEQFDYLIGTGIKKVELVMGTCKMCFIGERVYEFYKEPNKGKPAFAYNIQEKDGNIKDIFRCNFSNGYERDARKNTNPNIKFLY